MTLKDGIYEVKDLFYEDAGYMLAVTDGNLDFEKGAGQDSRLKLEIRRPEVDFGKTVVVPGFSKKRGEFAKSLVKTILKASESKESFRRNVDAVLTAYADMSFLEKTALCIAISMVGLVEYRGGPKTSAVPGRAYAKLANMAAKTMLSLPIWKAEFRPKSVSSYDPKDAGLQDLLVKDPESIPEYLWTEKDVGESQKILEANPFFRKYLAGNAV